MDFIWVFIILTILKIWIPSITFKTYLVVCGIVLFINVILYLKNIFDDYDY